MRLCVGVLVWRYGAGTEGDTVYTVAIKNDEGQTQGQLIADGKIFSTGSRGFYGQGKIVLDGKRYQVAVTLVEIGSKPQAGAGSK